MTQNDVRGAILEQKTYLRPLNEEETAFETFEQSVDRQIEHQRWLWQRAKSGMKKDCFGNWILSELSQLEESELQELRQLMLDRKVTLAGRTRWLGGTEVSKRNEACQFNCAFLEIRDIPDLVDTLHLLLQGCGVGFFPDNSEGNLKGYKKNYTIEVIRSQRTEKGGEEKEYEYYRDDDKSWRFVVGDSAEAWARSLGKILRGPKNVSAERIVIDLSNIRPEGTRLKGYGWMCSGDELIAESFSEIVKILIRAGNRNLSKLEIMDICNWLGRMLSSRRAAEICLMDSSDQEADQFAVAKQKWWISNKQREMSNNSIMYREKPSKDVLKEHFDIMVAAGGSEPGIINAEQAKERAWYFVGVNPCAEILLPSYGFCNLVETVLSRFNRDNEGLARAHKIVARANYRQTCVDLNDGVLQSYWHTHNEQLRLCGVGVTGVLGWDLQNNCQAWFALYNAAWLGATSMADELGFNRPANVTTIKPSGTASKTLSLPDHPVTEGLHKPSSKYIFNNVQFTKTDPAVQVLKDANYRWIEHPSDTTAVVISLPVSFADHPCWKEGELHNTESAVDQLNRYKMTMDYYTDHNSSVTVSYDVEEIPEIVDWIYDNWDSFVGVSFLIRMDPSKTAEDLGYKYLPQQAVTREQYEDYVSTLKPVVFGKATSQEIDAGEECAGGACPIR